MTRDNTIMAVVMLFVFAAVLITCSYVWGSADAQSMRADCQYHEGEATLLIVLPPDLDEAQP